MCDDGTHRAECCGRERESGSVASVAPKGRRHGTDIYKPPNAASTAFGLERRFSHCETVPGYLWPCSWAAVRHPEVFLGDVADAAVRFPGAPSHAPFALTAHARRSRGACRRESECDRIVNVASSSPPMRLMVTSWPSVGGIGEIVITGSSGIACSFGWWKSDATRIAAAYDASMPRASARETPGLDRMRWAG